MDVRRHIVGLNKRGNESWRNIQESRLNTCNLKIRMTRSNDGGCAKEEKEMTTEERGVDSIKCHEVRRDKLIDKG